MSYTIRLISSKEEVPHAPEVVNALRAEGFNAGVSASPSETDWEDLDVRVPGQEPITGTRSLRQGDENPVDEEVDNFLDLVLEEEGPGVERVEDLLRRARQMIVLEVPEAFPWGTERTVVDALVEFLADSTEALIQADGEGFYDRRGNLLLAIE